LAAVCHAATVVLLAVEHVVPRAEVVRAQFHVQRAISVTALIVVTAQTAQAAQHAATVNVAVARVVSVNLGKHGFHKEIKVQMNIWLCHQLLINDMFLVMNFMETFQ